MAEGVLGFGLSAVLGEVKGFEVLVGVWRGLEKER